MLEEETYEVETITLNTHSVQYNYQSDIIDCLWIDVQGAELLVLEGATDILPNIKSILLKFPYLNLCIKMVQYIPKLYLF